MRQRGILETGLEGAGRIQSKIVFVPKENDMIPFISELLCTSLHLPEDLDVCIERAHRVLTMRPKHASAPPRSIIVRFLDYSVKDAVLQQAWRQRGVTFEGEKIFFDQDYTAHSRRADR